MKQSRSGFLEKLEGLSPLRGRWLRYAVCIFWFVMGAALFLGSRAIEYMVPSAGTISFILGLYICARVLFYAAYGR